LCRTDEQCIRDCLDGHPEIFRHLVSRHQDALMGYLRGRLPNEEEAAEAAQETFVRAYFSLRSLLKPGSFPAWLLGIANRVAKETLRARRRSPQAAFDEGQIAETRAESDAGLAAGVTEAVRQLPEAYREVVLLRYSGGLSCVEISRNLGVPLGTVTKRLSRAYALLRKRLQEEPEGGSEVKS
jgi:RNA polymerase sigma-70 factor, ECF subfamily